MPQARASDSNNDYACPRCQRSFWQVPDVLRHMNQVASCMAFIDHFRYGRAGLDTESDMEVDSCNSQGEHPGIDTGEQCVSFLL